MTDLSQRLGQIVARNLVILNDQDMHGGILQTLYPRLSAR
jgi:hypothetical protein